MKEAPDNALMIDARRQQLIGVTYGLVERRSVGRMIRTVGVVDYDEGGLTDVSLKFHGWIENLAVDETGVSVEKGQVLFTFYSPELVSTQQEYLTAWDHYQRIKGSGNADAIRGAQDLLTATTQRLAYWDIEPSHLRDLESTREVRRALPIHSPAKGYVIDKSIVEGTHVQAGQILYRLANLDTVWILADIYESELPFIHVGQAADVTLRYMPGEKLAATITYVYPYVESKERTVKVRLELSNPSHQLRAGMYADVVLSAGREDVLVVPADAVVDSGTRQVVFVDIGEGRLDPREVNLGPRFEDSYQVLSGLEAGERVATGGNFLLDSESQLSAGMRQMAH